MLDISSVTFMIPLGLATAGAVRVGQALGRGEPTSAGHAGWTALALGAGFMACAGLVFATMPGTLLSVFTTDPAVIATGGSLMIVAAAFQLFDGLQGVSTGAMRGAGDTHTPMVCNLVSHWCIGLPIGYLLCFGAGLGVIGLWAGPGPGAGRGRGLPARGLDAQGPGTRPRRIRPGRRQPGGVSNRESFAQNFSFSRQVAPRPGLSLYRNARVQPTTGLPHERSPSRDPGS